MNAENAAKVDGFVQKIMELNELRQRCFDFENSGEDVCDDLHRYFDLWDRWNWTEVAHEGRRLWMAMFGEEIEHGSPQDYLIAAVAAQGADGVWSAVAAMLGIDKHSLMDLAMPWYHNQDKRPPAIEHSHLAEYLLDYHNPSFAQPIFTGLVGE